MSDPEVESAQLVLRLFAEVPSLLDEAPVTVRESDVRDRFRSNPNRACDLCAARALDVIVVQFPAVHPFGEMSSPRWLDVCRRCGERVRSLDSF